VRVALTFLKMTFDVFDDHDGVVYHQPGGQGDAEQSQRVNGESQ